LVPGIGSESILIDAPDSWRTWDIFEPFAPIIRPKQKNYIQLLLINKKVVAIELLKRMKLNYLPAISVGMVT
jgi:hypothetical protein